MNTASDNKTLTGVWRDGQIVLDEPVEWPEGCRVVITQLPKGEESLGITEEEWPKTPEAIAAHQRSNILVLSHTRPL